MDTCRVLVFGYLLCGDSVMASVRVGMFLFFAYFVGAEIQKDRSLLIYPNDRIHATVEPTSWHSPSSQFAFGFLPQKDGFYVGIWIVNGTGQNIMIWTANRDSPPVSSDAMVELSNGKLVLKTDNNDERVIVATLEPVLFASMHDSGNFVLHGESSIVIWESFRFPTDTILGGQKLWKRGELFSKASSTNYSTGRFRLKMQVDGNLVAYPVNTEDGSHDAYWDTRTNSYWDRYYLYLDNSGRLLLTNEFNDQSKQLNGNDNDNTNSTIYRATLDPDGNFRLYSNTSTNPLWAALNSSCVMKSFCGFNSYSTLDDYQPSCYCLPGTDFINYAQSFDGCDRNFTKQICQDGKAETAFYKIATAEKLKWDDDPYFAAVMTEEDCRRSWLEDCDCDVAEYDSNNCMKHKFPLRYIRRDIQQESTLLFKIGTRIVENGIGNTTVNVPYSVPDVVVTNKKTWLLILVMTVVLVTYSCIVLAASSIFIFKTRVAKYKRLLESGTSGLARELTLRLYSYNELKRATKGFKEELGKGSFGAVYKGSVNSGEKLVAVKRLQKLVEEGEREFQAEMRVIGKTHHKNLVRLLGYCTEGSNRLLVYEYMSNGSLAQLLFRSERRPDWHERVRIALDVARGILYLHEECEAPIIHCDIKPQNILMDNIWTAKISDFGLAKLLMPDQTKTFTDARGTRGYAAPE